VFDCCKRSSLLYFFSQKISFLEFASLLCNFYGVTTFCQLAILPIHIFITEIMDNGERVEARLVSKARFDTSRISSAKLSMVRHG
jgi:hypothetical protein